jgi:hypothetical protein
MTPTPRPLGPWPIAACAALLGLAIAVVAWVRAEARYLDCRADLRHGATR